MAASRRRRIVTSPARGRAAQARIEREIEEIDREIDDHEHERDEHQVGRHHRDVDELHRLDEQRAEARPLEHASR